MVHRSWRLILEKALQKRLPLQEGGGRGGGRASVRLCFCLVVLHLNSRPSRGGWVGGLGRGGWGGWRWCGVAVVLLVSIKMVLMSD